MYGYLKIEAGRLGCLLVGIQNDQVIFAHLVRRPEDMEGILAMERARYPGICAVRTSHPVASLLRAYLDGEPVDPVDIPVRWTRGTEFQQRVWKTLRRVRRGNLVTYGELANLAGSSKAARAVGSAMARNPLVLVVPCHRVVAYGGNIGGFSAGLDAKRYWLRLEGVDGCRLKGRIHDHSG